MYEGSYDFYAVHEISSTSLIVGGEMGALYKSTDSGNSWQDMSGTYAGIMDFEFVSTTTGFMTTEDGYIYKTTDGGASWAYSEYAGSIMHGVSFCDQNNGYTAGIYGNVFKTNNGGATFSECSSINNELVKMYPNPSDGKVYFSIVAEHNEEITIEISNICGSLIKTMKLNSGTNNNYEWNADELSNGMYNVKISSNGEVMTRKLIIAK